jgi:branched-chain amino acid transport system ATP-binding protein
VRAVEAATPLMEAKGLRKRFAGVSAVDGVDLAVMPGTITAMIGPNGAGKSTMINMLSGALLPTSGHILIGGEQVTGLHSHEFANLGLARTFQTPKLFEGLTTLETIMVARDAFGRSRYLDVALHSPRMRREERESRRSAIEWLDFVGVGDAADRPVSALPVGDQRLVEVARALAAEPDILLLDEPAAGLDQTETASLAELMRTIARTGLGVLVVEHDMNLVMSTAEQIVVLDAGRCIAAGSPAAVAADPAVIEAYLGVGTHA